MERSSFLRRRLGAGLSIALCAASSWAGPAIDLSPDRVKTDLNPGLERVGTIRPRNVEDVGDSNWTIGCECLDRDMTDYWQYNAYLAPLGIRTIRLQAGWAKCEKEKGKLDYDWLDRIVDDAIGRGLNVWLETDYGNPVYPDGGRLFPSSPEALAAWDRWVEGLARRYKGKVRDWAMWNEPDCTRSLTPEAVADFNIRTAEVIKRVDPDARIGALSLSWFIAAKYMPFFEARGKTGLFTWLVYHGYCKNPDVHTDKVLAMRKHLLEKWPDCPRLRQGEQGCPSEYLPGWALNKLPWSEFSQSKWILRRMMGDLGIGVESAIFTICDINYRKNPRYKNSDSIINRKGLLHTTDDLRIDKIKMSYYAVQNAVSVFDHTLETLPDDRLSVEFPTNTVSHLYRNKADGRQLFVVWDRSDTPGDSTVTRPATVTVKGCSIKDPVWVDLVSGRIYAFPAERVRDGRGTTVFKDVPVYDAPVLIAEKDLVAKK